MEEDQFTHQQTSAMRAFFQSASWLQPMFTGGKVDLILGLHVSGVQVDTLEAGFTVMVLMNDGTIVNLGMTEAMSTLPGLSYSVYQAKFSLDSATARQLALQPITALRGYGAWG